MRELVWMAASSQRSEWLRIGVLVSWIGPAVWSKEGIDALRVIPEEYRPPKQAEPVDARTPEEITSESNRAWHVLDRFFGG